MSVAICSTQLTTLDQAKKFIEYHQQLDFNKIIIFFDDPNDENIAELEQYPIVHSVVCDHEYWQNNRPESIERRQVHNTEIAVNFCRENNIQWLLHIDVDEFLYLDHQSSINDYVHHLSKEIVTVRIPACESIPTKLEHEDFLKEIKLFRQYPIEYRLNIKLSKLDKITNIVDEKLAVLKRHFFSVIGYRNIVKYGYMNAYTAGKSLTRVSAEIKSIGVHSSRINYQKKQLAIIAKKASILHFDAFSYKAWYQKWLKRIDGTGTSTHMHKERAMQLEQFKRLYHLNDQQQLEKLYFSIYSIPPKVLPLLSFFGLIKKVKR